MVIFIRMADATTGRFLGFGYEVLVRLLACVDRHRLCMLSKSRRQSKKPRPEFSQTGAN